MKDISEVAIEAAWSDVRKITPEEASDGIAAIADAQPGLLDFFIPYSDAMQPEAKSFALFLFYNICRIFINTYGDPVDKISDEEVEAICEINEAQLGDLETLDRAAVAEGLKEGAFVQPHIIAFVSDLLFSSEGAAELEPEDDYEPYDRGMSFLLIKTVIDALDSSIYSEDEEA